MPKHIVKKLKNHFELVFALILIVTVTLLNSLPGILGFLSTPKSSKYLGIVHWPADYFHYLSQFTQGTHSPFLATNLFSSDYSKFSMLEWVNMFLGFAFSRFGIEAIGAYQLSIAAFTFLFLFFSYLVIRRFYFRKKDWVKRLFFLFLFIFSNSFPIITFFEGKLSIQYHDFYFSSGPMFNRLGGVPHHLVGRSSNMLFLLLFFLWQKKRKTLGKKLYLFLLLFIIFGFVSASVDPVTFSLIATACGLACLIAELINNIKKRAVFSLKKVFHKVLPVIAYFFAGIPMVVYLKALLSIPPYTNSVLWDAAQQIRISFISFLLANGPVAVLSIIGVAFFFKKQITLSKIIALVFIVFSVLLFYSPVSIVMRVSNTRFLSPFTIFFMCYFSIEAIYYLALLFKKYTREIVGVFFILIFLILIPLFWVQIKARVAAYKNSGSINEASYKILKTIKDMSSPNDVFLADYPYNLFLPGIFGRQVYFGHEVLTINFWQKEQHAKKFFFEAMGSKEAENYLKEAKINYVLAKHPIKRFFEDGLIEKILEGEQLYFYKVK